jgi:hypothetical protein
MAVKLNEQNGRVARERQQRAANQGVPIIEIVC